MRGLIAGCAARPVAVSQLVIGLVLFGLVAASRLPVTLLPDLSYPTVTVRADLPGAAPEEVETLLTRPVEEAVGVIRNLRRITSRSQTGRSDVTIEFAWGTPMDHAVLDVRERLDALELPREARRPVVLRFDPGTDPILRYGLSLGEAQAGARHDNADLKRLRRMAEDQIQRPLEALGGVAAVQISGGLEDEIQVVADMQRLASFNLTLGLLRDRLAAENANISGGRVEQGTASYLVRTLNPFASIDEIRETIVVARADRNIYVRDVADVREAFRDRESVIRVNGAEAVEIAVYKEGDGNTVAVARAAAERIEALGRQLPGEFRLAPLYDQSRFISSAIDEVLNAAAIGGVLAIIVLYLFLRSAWITAVIAVTIPVSVIATFNVMYGAGLSLNIMSLGGIALAMGMLVDDAIVILENIARKREQGLGIVESAVEGTREVAAPVIASTLTTVAVFLPLVFVEGVAGQLFADQGIVVSGALLISTGISLTVIPALAARGARQEERSQPRGTRAEAVPAALLWPLVMLARGLGLLFGLVMRPAAAGFGRVYAGVERGYAHLLELALGARWIVLLVAALLGVAALAVLPRIGIELIPPFAQGEFSAEIELPTGTPLARTDAALARLAPLAAGLDGVAATYSTAGPGTRLDLASATAGEHEGRFSVVLAPGALDREPAIQRALAPHLDAIPGAGYRYTQPTLFSFDTPLEIELSGFDLAALQTAGAAVMARLRASGRYGEVESNAQPGQPELSVRFDDARVGALGLDTAELAERVTQAVDGVVATRYRLADREIDIRVRGGDTLRTDMATLRNLPINPEAAEPLTLEAVAEVRQAVGPAEIRRADGSRVVTIGARPLDMSLGEAVEDVRTMLADMRFDIGVQARVAGQSDELERSFATGLMALALAVFLVYLVMASQFESLLHPFVILFTIPLAGIGAIFTLWITGSVINVVSLIGFMVLAGVVVKNGIVLIDFINRLRAEGLPRDAAVRQAARARLRPILMTTATTVLALLPLLLGGAEGAEVRRPMALTLIGGLTVSTLLTLVVIPVIYTLLDRRPDPLPESGAGATA
jgi:HAE1 family hydrophobic/amphiphilic exporter-1